MIGWVGYDFELMQYGFLAGLGGTNGVALPRRYFSDYLEVKSPVDSVCI